MDPDWERTTKEAKTSLPYGTSQGSPKNSMGLEEEPWYEKDGNVQANPTRPRILKRRPRSPARAQVGVIFTL